MTIRKGVDWGETGPLAPGAPVVDTDAGAAEALSGPLSRALETDPPVGPPPGAPPEVGLVGGDLHRTLGAPAHGDGDLRAGRGTRYPIDVGVVTYLPAPGRGHGRGGDRGGGEEPAEQRRLFVAHVVARARRGWWAGRTAVVMNAAFVGDRNLGPRAHPDDGLLDLTDGALPRAEWRTGDRRSRTGSHVPHPALEQRRAAHHVVEHPPGIELWVDGVAVGRVTRFETAVLQDAAVVVA